MKEHLNTPTVLITGALTGIGRATALAFAHEGAQVVVSGRHNDEGQKLVTELRELGGLGITVNNVQQTVNSALESVVPLLRSSSGRESFPL